MRQSGSAPSCARSASRQSRRTRAIYAEILRQSSTASLQPDRRWPEPLEERAPITDRQFLLDRGGPIRRSWASRAANRRSRAAECLGGHSMRARNGGKGGDKGFRILRRSIVMFGWFGYSAHCRVRRDAPRCLRFRASCREALVAQWIERCPPEAEAAGSNPAECAIIPRGLFEPSARFPR